MRKFEFIAKVREAGVYDPGIFKAIFLAGGPGSGKSFVVSQTTGGHGLKIVSSDDILEYLMKARGLSLEMADMTEEELILKDKIRDLAKKKTNIKMTLYLEGRLGLVIDGTGKDYNKIVRQKVEFEKLGYDSYLIFVNTSLEVAKQRNIERSRTLPEDVVVKSWSAVQENMGKFQKAFGQTRFTIVDNNEYNNQKLLNSVWKQVMKFIHKPIENPVAQAWIKKELEIRNKLKEVPRAAKYNSGE